MADQTNQPPTGLDVCFRAIDEDGNTDSAVTAEIMESLRQQGVEVSVVAAPDEVGTGDAGC